MAKIAKDTPTWLVNMLGSIDFTRITGENYDEWIKLIKTNIGKHLKPRTKAATLIDITYPVRQDLCDLINGYDFNSMKMALKVAAPAAVNYWVKNNLPLKRGA
jgi:hypothetical protein